MLEQHLHADKNQHDAAAGLYIGRAFGSRWQKPAQIAGGIVLILIGVKVLFEHLGFLG